jgi:hypothetical protein
MKSIAAVLWPLRLLEPWSQTSLNLRESLSLREVPTTRRAGCGLASVHFRPPRTYELISSAPIPEGRIG